MTEENLEIIILGHIAKELKDEIQIERQVNLAKTIMQSIHDFSVRNELLLDFLTWFGRTYSIEELKAIGMQQLINEYEKRNQ